MIKKQIAALLLTVLISLQIPLVIFADEPAPDYESLREWNVPWETGLTLTLGQGYNGTYSHTATKSFQLDFGNRYQNHYIFAPKGGTIVSSGWDYSGFGYQVKIKTTDNFYLILSHLNSLESNIKPGNNIQKGNLIGRLGNTGKSTGAHLHFEISDLNGELPDLSKIVLFGLTTDSYKESNVNSLKLQGQFDGAAERPNIFNLYLKESKVKVNEAIELVLKTSATANRIEILNDSYDVLATTANPTTQNNYQKEWNLRYTMKNPKDRKLLVRVHNNAGYREKEIAVNITDAGIVSSSQTQIQNEAEKPVAYQASANPGMATINQKVTVTVYAQGNATKACIVNEADANILETNNYTMEGNARKFTMELTVDKAQVQNLRAFAGNANGWNWNSAAYFNISGLALNNENYNPRIYSVTALPSRVQLGQKSNLTVEANLGTMKVGLQDEYGVFVKESNVYSDANGKRYFTLEYVPPIGGWQQYKLWGSNNDGYSHYQTVEIEAY